MLGAESARAPLATEDQVDVREPPGERAFFLLGDTSAHAEDYLGPVFFEASELGYPGVEALLGIFPNAAGVKKYDVGLFGRFGCPIAGP